MTKKNIVLDGKKLIQNNFITNYTATFGLQR